MISENLPFSQWAILDQFSCDWNASPLVIEPGQTFQQTVEFVISREITTVALPPSFATLDLPKAWNSPKVGI